jgi:tetratricopeptide (TPR) repeat protein
MKKHIFTVLVVSMALLLAWRILVVGLGDHYARKALLGDKKAVDTALLWNEKHPKALYLKGKSLAKTEPEKAVSLLRQAIMLNPGDAAPMDVLARVLLKMGKQQQADEMMVLAVQRMPASKRIRLSAAEYWGLRQQLPKALENWAAALELDKKLGKRIYPLLMRLAENDKALGVFLPLAKSPPSWWDDFFEYLVLNTKKLETVVNLATLRHSTKVALSKRERALLVERLQKDEQWPEAYLVWINGLSEKQRRYLGSVFDGGFETPAGNAGFGWHFPEDKSWIVRRKHTYGVEGEKGLHILYKGEDTPAYQVFQYLLLGKGEYLLQLKLRVDRLRISTGLQWVVRCAGDNGKVLGATLPLVGASDWDSQQLKFKVPDSQSCRGQILRLEISDSQGDRQIMKGEVWFDRLSIRKLP